MALTWQSDHPKPLGATIPREKPYAAKYPLLAAHIDALAGKPVPVPIGIDWYENFDAPVKIGTRWWIGKTNDLGSIRGGHCVCLKPPSLSDLASWWAFYDQGNEGACVGFGSSRMQTLLNRARYDAPWLYHEAQKVDPWPGENYDGTSVDAAMQVLKNEGLKTPKWTAPRLAQGISAYRWTSKVDEIIAVMGGEAYRGVGGIPFLNSWGKSGYPHVTYMPLDVLQFLLDRQGDAAVVTDR
jgi:hypothetical protein